jgi:hypothetical protein
MKWRIHIHMNLQNNSANKFIIKSTYHNIENLASCNPMILNAIHIKKQLIKIQFE